MAIDQPKIVKGTLCVLLALSFGLCVSSFCSAQQCYTEPCYEGDGLDMLWSVDGGQSFQVVFTGLLTLFHVFAAYWILFKAAYDEMRYGMLVSATGLLAIMLLSQAVFWGQQSMMVDDLHTHLNGFAFYETNDECSRGVNRSSCEALANYHCEFVTSYMACQRAMYMDSTAQPKFDAVTAFSVLQSLCLAAFGYMLISWKEEFGEIFGGVAVASHASSRPSSSRVSQQFKAAEAPQAAASAQNFDNEGGASYQADNVGL